jgi:hypothetical protein
VSLSRRGKGRRKVVGHRSCRQGISLGEHVSYPGQGPGRFVTVSQQTDQGLDRSPDLADHSSLLLRKGSRIFAGASESLRTLGRFRCLDPIIEQADPSRAVNDELLGGVHASVKGKEVRSRLTDCDQPAPDRPGGFQPGMFGLRFGQGCLLLGAAAEQVIERGAAIRLGLPRSRRLPGESAALIAQRSLLCCG